MHCGGCWSGPTWNSASGLLCIAGGELCRHPIYFTIFGRASNSSASDKVWRVNMGIFGFGSISLYCTWAVRAITLNKALHFVIYALRSVF